MMSLRPTAGLRCVKYTPGKMLLSSLSLVTLWALAFGDAFVCLQPPAQQQHAFAHATNAVTAVRHISTAADTSRRGVSSSLPVKAAVGEKGASTPESGDSAKQRFFRNLERKRAGESVPSSALYGDLALLQTPRGEEVRAHDVTTTVTATASWRGKWEICFAPHIETLSKLILTKFSTVEYIFDADDGRMVSHAGFESKVFGSGWFNADGRIVRVPSPASATTAGVKDEGRQGQEVVKVIFERFWWDRNGEDRPTGTPPGATADAVDWFVQEAGKAMFFDGLSVFPVRYLDDDFCVFEFKAAGTVVASQRVG